MNRRGFFRTFLHAATTVVVLNYCPNLLEEEVMVHPGVKVTLIPIVDHLSSLEQAHGVLVASIVRASNEIDLGKPKRITSQKQLYEVFGRPW